MGLSPLSRLGAAVAALALLAGCVAGGEPAPAQGLAARVSATKKLTVGIRFDQPGLAQKITGTRFDGFDVDVASYVAKELGVEPGNITWKEVQASNRELLIKNGEVDFVVANYSINDTRKQSISFAGPYFVAGQGLLVRFNSPIAGPESLNGRKLCSVKDSTSAQKVREKFAKDAQLVEYFRYSECVTALLLSHVDAVSTDDVVLAGYAAQHPELLKVTGRPFTQERYGIGLKKDDSDGRGRINAAIEKMFRDGSWKASIDKNIGPSGYQIPQPPAITEK